MLAILQSHETSMSLKSYFFIDWSDNCNKPNSINQNSRVWKSLLLYVQNFFESLLLIKRF